MDVLSLAQVAALAGGRVASGDPATPVGPDVVIDSRLVTPGCLFVALTGERVDGHDYVAAAIAAGAAAALVSRPVAGEVPQVLVQDSLAGLTAMASTLTRQARARGLVVIGITGSSGKTSTKDLMAQIFERAGETVSPAGSFNNEIGVPLTALRVREKTRFLVSEMGARGKGHISSLCAITPPSIAVVLNVGTAHLGEFGSPEGIAIAKGELVESVDSHGWAVLNADDHRVLGMASRTTGRIALFATSGRPTPPADLRVWATEIKADGWQRHSFQLNVAWAHEAGSVHPVALQVTGPHMVPNALAAAAAALLAGVDAGEISRALSEASARSRWRMEIADRGDGVVILNDAYNANPNSMLMALETAAALRAAQLADHPRARLIGVLGDMLELGPTAPELHRQTGAAAAAQGFDRLVVVGEFAEQMLLGAKESGLNGVRAADAVAALAAVGDLAAGDVVLIKASRGVALEGVAQQLLADTSGAAGSNGSGT